VRTLIAVAIGSATLLLALNYALTARWNWVAAIAAAGLLWLAGSWHGRRWVSSAALTVFTVTAAAGVILRFPPLWLLSSVVAVLAAWDLERFAHYLGEVGDVRDEAELMRSHLRFLGFVVALGWCLGVVALSVRFTFDFVPTLALGLLVIMTLSGMIRYMRSASEGK
jgi:hypothetical protein